MQSLAFLALLASGAVLYLSWAEAEGLELPAFEVPLKGRVIGAVPEAWAAGASDAASAANAAEAPREVLDADGFVDLEQFTFADYDPPELRPDSKALTAEAFPAPVAELDGREVGVEGYMIVTEYADRALTSFLLSRFPPGCCFGAMPVADEWVMVRLLGEGVDSVSPYQSLAVRGRLEVGEELDEDGYCLSLYRLEDARVTER